ncbi:MAG: SurA N-terminal domain-containing protein [Nitrosopumilaceae archaeon]
MATKTTKTTKAKRATKPAAKTTPSEKKPITKKLSRFNLKSLAIPVLLLLIILLLGIFRGQFVAANVNGEQITRLELINELEKADGQRILQGLISQKLIEQEAEKRNITVSDEEVDAEIKGYEDSFSKQGQSLDTVLTIRGMTREGLKTQVKNQLTLEKMIGEEKLKVTDEEVNNYIETNKDSLPENIDEEELKNGIREELKQQKLNTEAQSLLAEIQSSANIEILLNQ